MEDLPDIETDHPGEGAGGEGTESPGGRIQAVVSATSAALGLELTPERYHGFLVKTLATTDSGAKQASHQAHIAITGESMRVFPVVTTVRYESVLASGDEGVDVSAEKSRFLFEAAVRVSQSNLESLAARAASDTGELELSEQDIVARLAVLPATDRDWILARMAVRFNIRKGTKQRQLELSGADAVFTLLRALTLKDDRLVVLLRSPITYDVLVVPRLADTDPPLVDGSVVPSGQAALAPVVRAADVVEDELSAEAEAEDMHLPRVRAMVWTSLEVGAADDPTQDELVRIVGLPEDVLDVMVPERDAGVVDFDIELRLTTLPGRAAAKLFSAGDGVSLTILNGPGARALLNDAVSDSILYIASVDGGAVSGPFLGLTDREALMRQDATIREMLLAEPQGFDRLA